MAKTLTAKRILTDMRGLIAEARRLKGGGVHR